MAERTQELGVVRNQVAAVHTQARHSRAGADRTKQAGPGSQNLTGARGSASPFHPAAGNGDAEQDAPRCWSFLRSIFKGKTTTPPVSAAVAHAASPAECLPGTFAASDL